MSLSEIEILGSSASFKVWAADIESLQELNDRLLREAEMFSIDPEAPGFHDCVYEDGLIRGFYSGVIPFEIEHLVDGISTKSLFKKIETCEFFATQKTVFTTGKSGPQKGLVHSLSALSGHGISLFEFEFTQMQQFQDRLSQVKAIVLANPKNQEVRRAKLSGLIESYIEYNVIDPRNHTIESVSGLIDSPLGPMTLTVSRKGAIRLSVRKGFILTMDCLHWILSLIRDESPPAIQKEML